MFNVLLTDVFLVFFRLLPSASKLLFLVYLGNIYGAKIVGEYALIASGLALYVALAGFEINAEVSRIVHAAKGPFWKLDVSISFLAAIIGLNIIFSMFGYLIYGYLPVAINISFASIMLWFVTEHLATEIFRLLIILNKRMLATFILFFKAAPALLLPIFLDWLDVIRIDIVEIAWFAIVFNFLSIITLAGTFLYKKGVFSAFYDGLSGGRDFDFFSIVKSLFSGAKAYYAVAIAGALAVNLDKFLINGAIGIEGAGRYYVISSIAGIYSLLISFTVGMRQAPALLVSYERDSRQLFIRKYRDSTRVLIGLSFPILFVVLVFYYVISEFFQRDLREHFVEFVIVSVGFFISSFSLLNRSILLLARAERLMFIANILPGIFFLLSIYLAGAHVGLTGICIIFLIASILTFLLFRYFSYCSEKSIINDFANNL